MGNDSTCNTVDSTDTGSNDYPDGTGIGQMSKINLDELLEMEQVELLFAVRHDIKPLLRELRKAREVVEAAKEYFERCEDWLQMEEEGDVMGQGNAWQDLEYLSKRFKRLDSGDKGK